MHEVLVVGAGPAGSVAALVLARAGVRVRLVDRSDFPRDKLCGDTLNPGALAILDQLGVGAAVRRQALAITGMDVTGPGSARVPADYPRGFTGASILRRDLDALLLDAAVSAGAAFSARVRVRAPALDAAGAVCGVVANDDELKARVVIAADGRRSTLASALGLARVPASPRRWAFGSYFEQVDGLTSRGEMHIRRDGYIGVAPLPRGLVNVCVVRDERFFRLKAEATSAEATSPEATSTEATSDVASGFSRKIVADAIASDARLRHRFARAREVGPATALGPLAVETHASGCPGLLLAGDAGGFVDPMTGDGLRFALRGGELAASAALDELTTGAAAFRALHAARAREFSGKWRLNRALRSLVASPRGVSVAASLASLWPAPIEYLVGAAGDISLAARTLAVREP